MEFDPTLRVSFYYIFIVCFHLFSLDQTGPDPVRMFVYTVSTLPFLTPRCSLLPPCTHAPNHLYKQQQQKIKAYFYFWMVASNDVETQQKGVVFLVYPTISKKDGGSGSSKGATISQMMLPNQTDRILHKKCNEAAPIRIAAVHFCLPNTPFFHLLRSVMTMTLPVSYRNRLKFHVGEGIELQYILKGFGIPTENLPITDTGNIKTTYLKQWLRVRKVIEVEMTPSGQSTKTLSIIECPRSVDVIFRPGTSMLCHPGNVTFRGLVESKQHRTTVKKTDKEQVALEIINDIQNLPNGGGRFLIWDNIGYWSDISNDIPTCVEKIAISYRDYKSKIRHSVSHTNNNTTANIMLPTAVTSLSRRPSNNNNNNKNKNNNNSSNKDPAATTTTTTTQSMNCSTYAFLGQQLDSNKKRKRTTKNNNLLCGGDSGGGASSSSTTSSSSSYQGCFGFK